MDRSFVESNRRELERLRKLVEQLDDRGLEARVNAHWTVAGVLGHVAFWDLRALHLAERLARGEGLSPDDAEEGDVDWINDAMRPLLHAIPPRALAELALRTAEDTDERVASLGPESLSKLWPADPASPLNPSRADHRGEHLDEIEKALGR